MKNYPSLFLIGLLCRVSKYGKNQFSERENGEMVAIKWQDRDMKQMKCELLRVILFAETCYKIFRYPYGIITYKLYYHFLVHQRLENFR